MRLLVACPECRRQYDASKLSPEQKFRCRCGQVLKVSSPKGHDAAVVRCSSCGATREKGASRCGHCGSDFTLHEQDLHTVCPRCFTRVSDRGNYCHACGQALTARTAAGEKSKLTCPSCPGQPHLVHRMLGAGEVAVLECQLCAGFWIESAVFEQLVKRVENTTNADDALFAGSSGARQIATEGDAENVRTKWCYRPCPACGKMMQRRHYARKSGVILDVCREDGLWFDAEELQQILAWIRAGGLAKAKQREAESQREARTRKAIAKASELEGGDDGWFGWGPRYRDSSAIIDVVISSIFGWP